MAIYLGCKCPICQKPFEQNDDVVVCPECGAPYHRACYEKEHQCVFADKHAAGFVWKPDPAATQAAENGYKDPSRFSDPQVSCPVCGSPNPATGLFCENCGSPLNGASSRQSGTVPPPFTGGFGDGTNGMPNPFDSFQMGGIPAALRVDPQEELEGIKASDWANFLGKNASFYLTNFKGMKMTGRKTSASFSAFFFGPFYFIYRKMWGLGFGLLAIDALLRIPLFLQLMVSAKHPMVHGLTMQALEPWLLVTSLLNLALMFAQGVFALYFYRKHGANRITAILSSNAPNPSELLAKSGGTSTLAVVLTLVATLIAVWAISAFALFPFLQTLL